MTDSLDEDTNHSFVVLENDTIKFISNDLLKNLGEKESFFYENVDKKVLFGIDFADIIDNIIMNSDHLYASSRDFLWSVNNNSDDPQELFAYLTSFGQVFYNQFDIAFSVKSTVNAVVESVQLQAFASRHIIFI